MIRCCGVEIGGRMLQNAADNNALHCLQRAAQKCQQWGKTDPRVLAHSLQPVQPTASPQPAADPCAVSFQMLAWLCAPPLVRLAACGLRRR